MSVTLTTSQQAAAAAPGAEFYVLVDLATQTGTYHFARENLTWSGIDYSARLVTEPEITLALGDPQAGVIGPGAVSVELANADGWFSRHRPEWVRGYTIAVREVFLDVQSDAVRTFVFRVTGAAMDDPGKYVLQAEDLLADARRQLIPHTRTLVSSDNFPGIGQPGAQGIGLPVAMPQGQVLCPIYLVDQRNPGSNNDVGGVYVACVGSANGIAYFAGGTTVVELLPPLTSGLLPPTTANRLSPVVSVSVVGSTVNGIPFTFVTVASGVPLGNPPTQRYCQLTRYMRSGFYLASDPTPIQSLLDLLSDSWGGAGVDPTLVDSPSQQIVSDFPGRETFGPQLHTVLTTQRPLGDYLADWTRETLTHILVKDKIYLIPETASRTLVASLYPGNIVEGSLKMTDVPLGQEESRQLLRWNDRTQDVIGGTTFSVATFAAGSGAQSDFQATFIGKPSNAAKVVQWWARYAAAGIRTYELETTVRNVALDPADLVTLTHTMVGATGLQCEVVGVTRAGGNFRLNLRELPTGIFSFQGTLPGDPTFGLFFQRVPTGINSILMTTGQSSTWVASHSMGRVPNFARFFYTKGQDDTLFTTVVAAATTTTVNYTVTYNGQFPYRPDRDVAAVDLST